MMNYNYNDINNFGGTMGENRAGTIEVRVPGCKNEKRLRGFGHHGTPQMPYLDHSSTLDIGETFNLLQLNIEGATRSKLEVLHKISKQHNVDVIALQETHHTADGLNNLIIPDYTIIAEKSHKRYGLIIYVKNDLTANTICHENIVEKFSISIKVNQLTITNTYKPPGEVWPCPALPDQVHPAVCLGDFNSHDTLWGYADENEAGAQLLEWMTINSMFLIHCAKQGGSFRSGRWGTETNPDLCFVSTINGCPIPSDFQILGTFPRSQHKPCLTRLGITIPIVPSHPIPRWNLRKADWPRFTKYMEENINRIHPDIHNYDRFCKLIISAAKKTIPRGYRKQYIPGWSEDSESWLREFMSSGDPEVATALLQSLDTTRRDRWVETMEKMNFSRSSRQAWSLLRKLDGGGVRHGTSGKINPNKIASLILRTSKPRIDKVKRKQVKMDLKQCKSSGDPNPTLIKAVTLDEIDQALTNTKSGKAPGVDKILPEFLKNLGCRARKWMSVFFTICIRDGKIPKIWHESNTLAILKPNKSATDPKNYRPISLLCVMYKLFERVLLSRITPMVESQLPSEQAGFRPGRSCCDQVLAITTYIERGFQEKLKSGATFVDLSSAYDTVWKDGLLLKLAKIINCNQTIRLIDHMLSNRKIRVSLGDRRSKYKILQNGLPQGSVLSPTLFNVFISDLPKTTSNKYIYADDIALVTQDLSFAKLEITLNRDMKKMEMYFEEWGLKPNPQKTVCSAFHLNNKCANQEIDVFFCGKKLRHEHLPCYLGVTLDRSLTYSKHLDKTKAKLMTRNNIINKLTGTSWGCDAGTLRTASMALVFSVAEYCSPVWGSSCHTKLVDNQLNITMRKITGTIRSTPLPWLPVLSNITPPDIRRKIAARREYGNIIKRPELPLYKDLMTPPVKRLKSRSPFWEQDFNPTDNEWHNKWENYNIKNKSLIKDPTIKPNGFELPRHHWSMINRFRTTHGMCAYFRHKCKLTQSPLCMCGELQTMTHIVEECPITALDGGMRELNLATEKSLAWLDSLNMKL